MDLFKLLGTIAIDNSEANKALDDTSKKGKNTESKLSKAFKGVGKGAAAVGKAVGTGMIVAGGAMAGLVGKAVSLAGDLEQNMGGSEAVFGDYADKMQAKAREAFSNMGLSTSDYLGTANKMGALFQGAGFSIEESMDLSSSAMQRAADVASIMGIDTESAMEAIAGAAKGNFTMMDNLGVAMNDTNLQAYALSKGINKSTSEMTQQEKIGLAMEMFMDKTAYAAGNYAKENETLAGSLGTAKAALTNFLDGSGNADQLVDAFANAADVLVKNITEIAPRLIEGLTQVVNEIIPMLPPLLEELLPTIVEGATTLINGLVAAMPDIITALMDALPSLIDGVTQIINALIENLPGIIEALVAALPDLIPMLIDGLVSMLVTLCGSFSEIIQPIIDNLPAIITSICDALITNLPTLLAGLLELATGIAAALPETLQAVLDALDTVIQGLVDSLLEWAAPILENVAVWWEGVKTATSEKWEEIKTAISTAWENIKTAIGTAIEAVKTSIATAWENIKTAASTAWEAVKTTISTVWESIKTAASTAWESVKTTISTVWEGIKTGVSTAIETVKATISGAWESVKTATSNAWNTVKTGVSTVVESVKSTISSTFDTVKSKVETVWNGVKSAIQTPIESARDLVKGAIDKIKGFFDFEFTWPKLKLPHFSFSGSWNPFDWPDKFPKLGVEWYAKAMQKPMLMTEPTIFGYNTATGQFMGGGEAGSEVVAGTDTLMGMISTAVAARTNEQTQKIVAALSAILEAIITGNQGMIQTLADGHTIVFDNREVARMVRKYA